LNIRNAIAKYADALKALAPESHTIELPAMPASAEALTALALAAGGPPRLLWIHHAAESLERAHSDLISLREKRDQPRISYFPPWDALPGPDFREDPEIAGYRLRALRQLTEHTAEEPLIVVTSVQALLQATPLPDALAADTITLEVDIESDLGEITDALQASGYAFEPEVASKGQATRKGGLLDVWAPTDTWPTRIEFFGPVVESIRRFDPATQRSVEKIPLISLPPAREWDTDSPSSSHATLIDYINAPATLLWSEPGSIAHQADAYETLLADAGSTDAISSFEVLQQRIAERQDIRQVHIDPDKPVELPGVLPRFSPIENAVEATGNHLGAELAERARKELLDSLYERTRRRHHVALFFDTSGSLSHFSDNLAREDGRPIHTHKGVLSEGCNCPDLRLTVVAESDLYGRRKTLRRRYDPDAFHGRAPSGRGARISDFTDMATGDLVVHIDHGVGRYLGVREITFNDKQQEVLAIEYADEAKLYVPMSHAHLLSRYVGISAGRASLHKLGGTRWKRDKDAAQQAVLDLAADLLQVQAARNLLRGYAYPTDTTWQHEFENAFPFQETVDQINVIRDVKQDMESPRPMDRLICGDAGYGKTEVAMRAAFKAVQHGQQVAMLVPTTILAQQHYRTFSERMAGFPVRIEVLSRFCTASARTQLLKGLGAGEIDIVIGTHALVQSSVSFTRLGLVIIDEEQRFGVRHKEHLKQMKQLVDVLTLSATPIPRTLYMSMTGARDMSLLQTPPRERMAIETIVATADDEVIREAVLREIGRNGQVYYLHNRVMTIRRLRDRLARLIPEARIEVAHGQMKSSELASVMRRFSAGEFDVLLCTTIIESGMDIPRANTILIDRSDRFGIADLYQLRGRVGRSRHKAYAYLLLPPHGHVDSDARERIRAIRKHSGLGAGFNLAVRDMEIRGAGNILGAAQSGHISAVGFGLYCQLLKQSVARLKGEQPDKIVDTELRLDFVRLAPSDPDESSTAYLPDAFIPDERVRVAVYRRIAEATDADEVHALRQELGDRFGQLPSSVERLLTLADIRILASNTGIHLVEVRNRKIILKRDEDYIMDSARFTTLTTTTPDDQLQELHDHIRELS